jgi:uncharacterized repeat protein (TIGR01451 family)
MAMRNRWIVPAGVALLSLALVLLWSRMASQALIPPGDSQAVGPAGQEESLDNAAAGARQPATVPDLSLVKTAAPGRVPPGGLVTYTLTFSNSSLTEVKTLDSVVDILPEGVTFKGMTDDSDVSDDPYGLTGPITWAAPQAPPPSIDPLAELSYRYVVTMPLTDGVTLVNSAYGYMGSQWVGPESAEVKIGQTGLAFLPISLRNYSPPRFTVAKSVYPSVAFTTVQEAVFTYTVGFYNEGTVPGVLADIRDTLPTGFEFAGMVADLSDVDSDPAGTTGEIIWTGPFTVAREVTLTLVYSVTTTPELGTYVNSATATTVEGKGAPPKTPGQAVVSITEPLYMEEDWQGPISEHWRPYLNHGRLAPEQWFIVPNEGWGGSAALKHTRDAGGKVANDALYMYYDPAAEGWSNYRYEAKVNISRGEIAGLWFRGKVEQPDPSSEPKHDEGYYFMMSPGGGGGWVRLGAVSHNAPFYPYYFDNVREIAARAWPINRGWWYTLAVEVRGTEIKCYVDGDLVFTENDSIYSSGTIGMKTYRVESAVWDDILVTPLAP